jgi:hypothetical protein
MMPWSGTPFRKNGGSIRQPNVPDATAWRVKLDRVGQRGAAGRDEDAVCGDTAGD